MPRYKHKCEHQMREKKLIKMIQKALEKDHIYNQDEILYMKKELNSLKDLLDEKRKKSSKGFKN